MPAVKHRHAGRSRKMFVGAYDRSLDAASSFWTIVRNEVYGLAHLFSPPNLKAVPEADPTSGRAAAEPGMLPVTMGNELTVIPDGPAFKKELLDQIRNAKKSIWINVYEWADDASGNKIAAAIMAAKRKNPELDVRIIIDNRMNFQQVLLDPVNKGRAPDPIIQMLQDAHCDVRRVDYAGEKVNHRKIFLFDGETSLVGGQNIGDANLNAMSADHWEYFDATTEARGPQVFADALVFRQSWYMAGGDPRSLAMPKRTPPEPTAHGADTKVQGIWHVGEADRNIERELVQRIDSESGYLDPNTGEMHEGLIVIADGFGMCDRVAKALERAASPERHNRVVYLWGEATPEGTIMANQHLAELAAAGIEVRNAPFRMHMKAYYFKNRNILIHGSANTDGASAFLNDEYSRQYTGGSYPADFYAQVLQPKVDDFATIPRAGSALVYRGKNAAPPTGITEFATGVVGAAIDRN